MKLQVVTEAIWQPFGNIASLPSFSTQLAVYFTPTRVFSGLGLQSPCLTSREITQDKGRENCFNRCIAWTLISCVDGPEEDAGVWSQKNGKSWGSQITSWEITPFTNNVSLLLQDMLWLTQLLIFCLIFPPYFPHFFLSFCVLFGLIFAAKLLRQGSSVFRVYRAISRKTDRFCTN